MGAVYKSTVERLLLGRMWKDKKDEPVDEQSKSIEAKKTPVFFVEGYKDLRAMAVAIQSGQISESDLSELVCFLLATASNKKQHIQLLHFKFV